MELVGVKQLGMMDNKKSGSSNGTSASANKNVKRDLRARKADGVRPMDGIGKNVEPFGC